MTANLCCLSLALIFLNSILTSLILISLVFPSFNLFRFDFLSLSLSLFLTLAFSSFFPSLFPLIFDFLGFFIFKFLSGIESFIWLGFLTISEFESGFYTPYFRSILRTANFNKYFCSKLKLTYEFIYKKQVNLPEKNWRFDLYLLH